MNKTAHFRTPVTSAPTINFKARPVPQSTYERPSKVKCAELMREKSQEGKVLAPKVSSLPVKSAAVRKPVQEPLTRIKFSRM
jgi:hypothetical protein